MHKHLRRLERVWLEPAIYYITICTFQRKPILATEFVAQILVQEWKNARKRHGWAVGRYVIMPDHVHFFCAAELDAKSLSDFIREWKSWTSRRIHALRPRPATAATTALWQREFFDHVLRSGESYSQKWDYVRDNPVRAGLVSHPEDCPFSGTVEVLQT